MNIHFFCPRYLYAGGGSVLYTRRLAEEMARRGHTVTLVTDRPLEPPRHPEPPPTGVSLRTLERDPRVEAAACRRLALADRRGFYRFAQWLYRSGKQQLLAAGPWCPDLAEPRNFADAEVFVLVNSGSTAFGEALRHTLAWRSGQIRAALPLFHPQEAFARYEHHDTVHLQVDWVGTLSDYERAFLIQRGWPEEVIDTLGAGSDELPPPGFSFREKFRVPEAAPLVLFVGRKIHNKGLPHVIQAMDSVWRAFPEARLVLLGYSHNPPAWLEDLLAQAQPPAPDRVINLDDASEADREAALAACDLLAAPSISDSFGIVYLDAWRHAKPVIACRDTCCETFIEDGRTGLLVPFGDVPAIGEALLALLREPARARALGEAGRQVWRERFQWSQVADRFEAGLRKIAAAKRLPWTSSPT
jgi:glycosyltransferase involved in cell wall biosynthesis